MIFICYSIIDRDLFHFTLIRSVKMGGQPLLMMTVRAVLQKPPDYFFSNREKFPVVVNEENGVEDDSDDTIFLTDDYRNLYRSISLSQVLILVY